MEGAALNLGEAMTPITLNYTVNANATSGSSGGSGSSGSGSGSSSTSSFVYENNKLAAGGRHTCAILDNGDVKCWGYNWNGQLGTGSATTSNVNVPPTNAIDLGTGRTAVALSAGYDHTCAILDNGVLKCWGVDSYGVMANGGHWGSTGSTHEHAPATIDLGTGRTAVAVSAGYGHTCVILDNGDLKCWGQGDAGQNLSLIHISEPTRRS